MEVFTQGPMHPDLFDGETPIMTPISLKAFKVMVSYYEPISQTVFVVAPTQKYAEKQAERLSSFCPSEHDQFYIVDSWEVDPMDTWRGEPVCDIIQRKALDWKTDHT